MAAWRIQITGEIHLHTFPGHRFFLQGHLPEVTGIMATAFTP